MATELLYLGGFSVLFFLTIAIQGVIANLSKAHGPKVLAGARDNLAPETVMMGRARRTVQNSIEAAVLFLPAVVALGLADGFGAHSALGAAVFFWARVAFIPAYLFGMPWLRTLVWASSLIGVGMVWVEFFTAAMQG
jgi:uncharacterized MAPEG superfamily protein